MRTRRLFVAAMPPVEVARALHEALPASLPDAFKPIPPEQIHLTLQFIGNVGEKHLDAVIVSMTQALAGLGPQTITPRRIATFPEKPPARLIAVVATCTPQLREAQKRLALRLARVAAKPGNDRFEPHFTISRCSPPQPSLTLDLECTLPAFELSRICLFESILSPTGSHYRLIHEVILRS